jgi:putative ABC transport system permease protein
MDLKLAVRGLRRSPAFTVSAVMTLAIGLGGCMAMFTLVQAVLLRPLPYPDADRLVRIREHQPDGTQSEVSPGSFVDWRQRTATLSDIALFSDDNDSVDVGGSVITTPIGTIQVIDAVVSANFFSVLGVRPLLGRVIQGVLAPEVERGVVIGYALWRDAFAADPGIVGSAIRIEGRTVNTVVGVMPEGFSFPGRTQLWRADDFTRIGGTRRAFRSWGAIGRLRSGSSVEGAVADLSAISRQLEVEHPATNAGWTVSVQPLQDSQVGGYRRALLVLLGATALVILVGCANVSNLLIARGAARHREVAVRAAIGATRGRIVRELLTESLLIATVGVAGGLALAWWLLPSAVRLVGEVVPRVAGARLDGPAFALAALLLAATTLLIGLVPALKASRADLSGAIAAGGERSVSGGGRLGVQQWMVAVEIAASLVLLSGALLMIQAFARLRAIDVGFDPAHVVAAYARLPIFGAEADNPLRRWVVLRNGTDQALQRLRTVPGVQAVAVTNDLPLSGSALLADIAFDEEPLRSGREMEVSGRRAIYRRVSPGFFRTMGMTLRSGRDFRRDDASTEAQLLSPRSEPREGAIIVNEAAARQWWPGLDPLQQSIRTNYDRVTTSSRRVVGVVADVRAGALTEPPSPEVYVPYFEDPSFAMTFVLRTTLPPDAIGPAIRRELIAVNRDFSTAAVRTMDDVVTRSMGSAPFRTLIVSVFSGVGLVLAAVGVYGVVAFGVAQRRREIGIRIALGARPADVAQLFLVQAIVPIGLGTVAGLAGAVALGRVIASLLYGVSPTDPYTLLTAAALIGSVGLIASYLPVRRALRAAPVAALRD